MSMILRKWSANIRTAQVEEYLRYVEETGAGDYRTATGYLAHQILVRDLGEGISEFSTLSWWTDMDAIKAFAGDLPERARYYPEDDRYLLTRPEEVEHHHVVSGTHPPNGQS
ncbi:hypothetical protein ACQKKX_08565 [Neorhizobium sp. NPDC001467]|uniref:hypothetical protein n=1 Tax=Neorhizobium sp. NPDC001467 TaxID=3390595 RepID=UPI003D04D378